MENYDSRLDQSHCKLCHNSPLKGLPYPKNNSLPAEDNSKKQKSYRDLFLGKSSPLQNGILKMDTLPLDNENDWLRRDEKFLEQVELKRNLYNRYPDEVLALLNEGQNGASEAVEKITEYLDRNKLSFEGKNKNTFFNLCLSLQEDVVLLHQRKDKLYYLVGGSLCFPSAWSLKEKLGKNISEIHADVPLVNKNLGKAIDLFLQKMEAGKQYWRINFLTSPSSKLEQLKNVLELNDYHLTEEIDEKNVASLFLRNERQVFTKLKKSKDIIFTLKTYISPFSELDPLLAKKLAFLLNHLPAESIKTYRKWSEKEKKIVIEYLVNKK